ncbi:MAG TPA: DUF2231 domain-containing protein [Salinisphaeraceae bacterium]|nr:DUF2231 domain-containing protein [Salinisphaeraceae bacterium]
MRQPLHPALVHFPIACWTIAVIVDFVSPHFGAPAWQLAALMLAIGCGMALLAMCAGLLELTRVPDGAPLRDLLWHMSIMSLALVLFLFSLGMRLVGLQPQAPGLLEFILDGCGFLALIVGGWLGGRLVYRHGVGRR